MAAPAAAIATVATAAVPHPTAAEAAAVPTAAEAAAAGIAEAAVPMVAAIVVAFSFMAVPCHGVRGVCHLCACKVLLGIPISFAKTRNVHETHVPDLKCRGHRWHKHNFA